MMFGGRSDVLNTFFDKKYFQLTIALRCNSIVNQEASMIIYKHIIFSPPLSVRVCVYIYTYTHVRV